MLDKSENEHKCPFDGDITNDCADCAYSGDYHYDYQLEDCILRENPKGADN